MDVDAAIEEVEVLGAERCPERKFLLLTVAVVLGILRVAECNGELRTGRICETVRNLGEPYFLTLFELAAVGKGSIFNGSPHVGRHSEDLVKLSVGIRLEEIHVVHSLTVLVPCLRCGIVHMVGVAGIELL